MYLLLDFARDGSHSQLLSSLQPHILVIADLYEIHEVNFYKSEFKHISLLERKLLVMSGQCVLPFAIWSGLLAVK